MVRNRYLIGLTLPYARIKQGRLIAANEMFRLNKPPDTLECPLCGDDVIFRHIENRRPHFSHISSAYIHHTEEEINHDLTVLLIEQEFINLIKGNANIKFYIKCRVCGRYHRQEIISNKIAVVVRGKCYKTIRPDILLYDDKDNPVLAFEVVVTHPIDQSTLDVYKKNNILVIEYVASLSNSFNSFYLPRVSGYMSRKFWAKNRPWFKENSRFICNSISFECPSQILAKKLGILPLPISVIVSLCKANKGSLVLGWSVNNDNLDIIKINNYLYWFNIKKLSNQVNIKKRFTHGDYFSWFFLYENSPFAIKFDLQNRYIFIKKVTHVTPPYFKRKSCLYRK